MGSDAGISTASRVSVAADTTGGCAVMTILRARVPGSRRKTTWIPTRRRNDAARRSRPDRARPLPGHASDLAVRSGTRQVRSSRSFVAVPSHLVVGSFAVGSIILRNATATGLASSTLSTAAWMLAL
jgi:hypothetical protein